MVTKIVVVGLGYVGIPAAALLADVNGHEVTDLQRRLKRSGWKIDVTRLADRCFPKRLLKICSEVCMFS